MKCNREDLGSMLAEQIGPCEIALRSGRYVQTQRVRLTVINIKLIFVGLFPLLPPTRRLGMSSVYSFTGQVVSARWSCMPYFSLYRSSVIVATRRKKGCIQKGSFGTLGGEERDAYESSISHFGHFCLVWVFSASARTSASGPAHWNGWDSKENFELYQTKGCQKNRCIRGDPLSDSALIEGCFVAVRFSDLSKRACLEDEQWSLWVAAGNWLSL